MIRIFCFFSTICVAAACSSDKAREEVVGNTCSTANVTYSNTISPIINASGCLGCHGAAAVAPFTLQTYEEVKAKAAETRSGTSVLFGAVSHMNGFTPMPQGLPQLSSCDRNKIKAWIDAGMPQ